MGFYSLKSHPQYYLIIFCYAGPLHCDLPHLPGHQKLKLALPSAVELLTYRCIFLIQSFVRMVDACCCRPMWSETLSTIVVHPHPCSLFVVLQLFFLLKFFGL
ncbi:hypothetical protein NC651_018880 [Populus alba x Populus x berolinensis]|nr:hypothetical protein NC651_018880 [Populus alba x Populus x berolinensis]